MKSSTIYASLLGSLLLSVGCSSSSTAEPANGGTGGSGGGAMQTAKEFEIFPPTVYTGYDGQNKYQAPIIAVNNTGSVTWTLADPSLADLAPESDGTELMITAKKAGTTMITAKSGEHTSTASLTIYSYTPAQHMLGEHRYMNMEGTSPACIECHTGAADHPNHSPTEVDADNDEDVQHTFLTGTDPEGRPIAGKDSKGNVIMHQWTVTEEEKAGLMSYLRSLKPIGYPEYDEPTAEGM